MTKNKSDLLEIPGIGKTFVKDFARIGITSLSALEGHSPEVLYEKLKKRNAKEGHKTSKNYLYVIRMSVYYADGGRDPSKLIWNSWTD